MIGRLRPWLIRRLPTLYRNAIDARARVVDGAARFALGELVFPRHVLDAELAAVAGTTGLGGAVLTAVLDANLEVHGADAVNGAADRALGRLTAPRRARLCLALAACLERAGGLERPLALRERAGAAPEALADLRAQVSILRDGIAPGPAEPRAWQPRERCVLYYANQTRPHHTSGYAIRTHAIARALRHKGWDLSVYARYGYPNDRYDFIGAATAAAAAEVDGVPYRFTPDRASGFGSPRIGAFHAASVDALFRAAAELRPAIIHAASNHTGGLAGTEAARRLGIPSIYEVRGLWHLTRASEQQAYDGSDHFRLIHRLELQAARTADRVLAITDAVADILVDGGVPREAIAILPNAVDPDAFAPRPRDEALAAELGLASTLTIGYVGALKDYEGLDYLLRAAAALRRDAGDSFRVLIVGDGKADDDLRRLADSLGVAELVRFTGRVPHEHVGRYYSVIDAMAFPRKGFRVCEVVSPLKPFEAMAAAKPIVVSSVRALAEIVTDGDTGLVHAKDDVDDLARQLGRLIGDAALRERLGQRARAWIAAHRTWDAVCDTVDRVYRELTG